MTHSRRVSSLVGCIVAILLLTSCQTAAAGPKFQITEYVGEDWMGERVSFPVTLPKSLDADKLVVRGDDGNVSAAQFVPDEPGSRKGRVHFVVDLPAGSKRTWELRSSRIFKHAGSDIFLKKGRGVIELGTSRIAVRCPWNVRIPAGGIAAADAPAPIQAVRLADGTWGCSSRMHSPLKVLAIKGEVLISGPVFAKIRITYTFEGDKTHTVELEAIAGQEVIVVSERSQLGHETGYMYRRTPKGAPNWNTLLAVYKNAFYSDSNYWTLSFSKGLAADRVAWTPKHQLWSTKPNSSTDQPHEGGMGLLVGGRSDGDDPEPGELRFTYAPPKKPSHLITLNPSHGEWSLNVANWGGFYSSRNENFVAVMALRPGDWRSPHKNVIMLETDQQARLRAVLPINTGQRVWGLYGSPRDAAIYYPSEQDWPNPRAYMEKAPKGEQFPGMQYARPPQLACIKYGYLPLDMVKDWTLEWTDPPELKFPHLFAEADDLPAIRKRIAATPELNGLVRNLKNYWDNYRATNDPAYPHFAGHFVGPWTYIKGLDNIYMATGDEVYAEALTELLIVRLRRYVTQTKSHDGLTAESFEPYLVREADMALGSRSITPQQRRQIRAMLIFIGEVFHSPHHAPRGLGYNHHGTQNLRAIAYATAGSIGCLFPSHPSAAKWAKATADDIEIALAGKQYLPHPAADVWYSFYHLEITMFAAMQLQRAGFADFLNDPRLREGLEFFGQMLTVPDPRHGNTASVVPFGNGNGSRNKSVAWAIAAAELADEHPQFARRMMWYWRRAGSPSALRVHGDRHDQGSSSLGWIDGSIPAEKPDLKSRYVNDWGALFRSGYGTASETFMALQLGSRGGLNNKYNAEGALHLYAKGKPLCLLFGVRSYDVGVHGGFTNLVRQRWMANRPSFGFSSEFSGEAKTLGFASTSAADVASGEWNFSRLTSMALPNPKTGPGRLILSKPRPEAPGVGLGEVDVPRDVEPITWRRHVMFVKDADPTGPNYFIIRDAAESKEVWDWNIWCLANKLEIDEQTQTGHFSGKFGVDLDIVPLEPVPELVTGSYGPAESVYGDWHQKLYQVQMPGSGEFAAVLYPRTGDEPAPKITPWAGGAGAKIVLPDQTHYVLLADKPITVTADGVEITGQSAVVRNKGDVTSLTLLVGTHVGVEDFVMTTIVVSKSAGGAITAVLDRKAAAVTGDSSGGGCDVILQLPTALTPWKLTIDGKPAKMTVSESGGLQFTIPKGEHVFSLK